MMTFLSDLQDMAFLQYALMAGLLSSVACGVVGSFVVVRRITYIAGAIAHCVLGGMGLVRYLNVVHDLNWLSPVHGALVSALLAAVVIGYVSLRAKEREDTIISALWAVGMASGVLFISRTPGYGEDLMSYLFGNILMVSKSDLWLIVLLDLLVIVVCSLFYNQLVAVCFDEEFARLRGINVEFYFLMLLCLTAITVVLLVSVVGIIMVIALLSLPVAVASQFSKNMKSIIVLSSILCALFTFLGLSLSYTPDLPSGALTVVIAGLSYIFAIAFNRIFVHRYKKEA